MFVANGLKPDPENEGWVLRWPLTLWSASNLLVRLLTALVELLMRL